MCYTNLVLEAGAGNGKNNSPHRIFPVGNKKYKLVGIVLVLPCVYLSIPKNAGQQERSCHFTIFPLYRVHLSESIITANIFFNLKF